MGHTRLSILDLSSRGNQPMSDHSGDWIISFNGEIYNHLEIRNIYLKKYKTGYTGKVKVIQKLFYYQIKF